MKGSYAKYKEATASVINWISDTSGKAVNSCKDIFTAAGSITKSMPYAVAKNLQESITLRIKVRTGKWQSDKSKAGYKHQAFINLLKHVRGLFAKKVALQSPTTDVNGSSSQSSNPFHVFSSNVDDNDDLDLTQELQSMTLDEPPAELNEISVSELLNDDICATMLLLSDFEEMFGQVCEIWTNYKINQTHQGLITATVMTSELIHQAKAVSSEFFLSHKHIPEDFHYLVALTEYSLFIENCKKVFPEVSIKDLLYATSQALYYLDRRFVKLAENILKNTSLTDSQIALFFVQFFEQQNRDNVRLLQMNYSLFSWSKYMSKEHNICYTYSVLHQILTEVFREDSQLIVKNGWFGPKYSEEQQRNGIEQMQTYLSAKLLPHLLNINNNWKRGNVWKYLINMHNTNPLNSLILRDALSSKKNNNRTISLATLFSIHASYFIATIVQGENTIKKAYKLTKNALVLLKKGQENLIKYKVFSEPKQTFLKTEIMIFEAFKEFMKIELDPYQSGCILVTSLYAYNLNTSLPSIDSLAQTRNACHLYNALRLTNNIDKIDIFERLMNTFKTKPIWLGGKPTKKGDFSKSWFLAIGFTAEDVTVCTEILKLGQGQNNPGAREKIQSFLDKNKGELKLNTKKELKWLDSGDVYKSFEPVFKRQFPNNCENEVEYLKKVMEEDHKTSFILPFRWDLLSIGLQKLWRDAADTILGEKESQKRKKIIFKEPKEKRSFHLSHLANETLSLILVDLDCNNLNNAKKLKIQEVAEAMEDFGEEFELSYIY